MGSNLDLSPEEIEKLLEKARRDAQAMLDKMTPEQRAQAQAKAQRRIEEDRASMQKMLDDAARIAAESVPKAAPKFCGNCGAPADGGKYCAYCGSLL